MNSVRTLERYRKHKSGDRNHKKYQSEMKNTTKIKKYIRGDQKYIR